MAPAVQSNISFPCRKPSVRRKMDFEDGPTSPAKSPRKENVAVQEDTVRLTRSATRQARTPSQRVKSTLRSSPRKTSKNLFPDDSSVPAVPSPRKTPKKVLGESADNCQEERPNTESQPTCIRKASRSLFSDDCLKVTSSPSKAAPVLLSPTKTPKKNLNNNLENLVLEEKQLRSSVTSSPSKVASILDSPRKTPKKNLNNNLENLVQEERQLRSSPRKLQLQHPDVSTFAKARRALHSSVPDTIFCRDKELASIGAFLQPAIENRKPGSMYISGRPGTGKTACVTYTLNNQKFAGKFKSIFINCMVLQTPSAIYQEIAKQLDPKWNASSKAALAFIEDKLTSSGPMIVLVLDEVDQMSTRDQSVLYTLFELPALTDSRLILIGLANALDLTDRALVRLQSRVQFKPVLLNFPPYSKQDIATILSQRIREAVSDEVSNVIAPSALQYLGGKISSSSGDLRKAIDICRRAVELAETSAKKQLVLAPSTESPKPASKCVGIPLLCKMMASVESNRFCAAADSADDVDETPLQQKLIVATLLVLVKLGKSKQVTLGKLHASYSKVCAKFGVTAMDFDEFAHTCSLVESRGIVTLKSKKGNVRLTPICLRLDEREVESTLKDKTLLSSILTQGSLFI